MAGTYYFLTSVSAIAYDYDDSNRTTRNTSKDRNIRTILSGIRTVDMNGGTATDNRIALLNHNDRKLYILDHNWSRISAEDVTLHSGKTYRAVCATNNRWVVTNITDQRLEFWDFSGSEQTGERQNFGTDAYNGLFSDGTYIYLVNDTDNSIERRTYTNARLLAFISNLGTGNWRGGTSTPARFLVVDDAANIGVFYNHSGTLQSSERINLGADNYDGVIAVEESAATLTLSTTDTDIRPNEQVNINIVSDIDISDFAATDITVRNGTRGTLTRTDARNYVLSVTAGSSAGTMTVSIAADVVSPGNAAVSQNFTINPNPVVASDLVVSITGTTNIVQFQRTTLTAAVTDADSNAITSGLTYAWTASRGRFIGATNEASAVYEANFTDSSDVEATITCAVTLAADAMPTSDGASLTALSDIGVTGVLVNMFMTALGPVSSNANNALYQDGSVGTLDSGSDQQLDTNIKIWRVRWNNDSNRIILNNNQTGSLQTYFTTNTDKSLYVVFEDGTYVELPQSALVSTGTTWAQWSVTDANIIAKLNALTTTSDLTIGVADADSIGFDANSGSGTATVTATPIPTPAAPANFAETHTHNSATLSWTSLAGETYEVRQGSNAWSDATSPHTVSGLSPSTAYTFQVRVKAKGRTPAGDAASINLTTNAAPLIAPSVPGNLAATVIDHDTVRLTFSASTGTVTQYQYRYATSSGALSGTSWSDGGTGTTIDVDGLSPSTQYYFQVRALNQTVGSAATSAVTATTQAAPLVAPSVPGSLAAAAIDHDTVRLTFTASTGTVTQYQYKVATSEVGLASVTWNDGGTGTTITVDGLSPSTQYYFQVRACNQTVYSAATSAVTATTQAPPLVAAPSNFSGTVAIRGIRLTWDEIAGATYEVRRGTDDWEDATSPHQVIGLMPATAYTLEVRVKASGAMAAGNAASVTLTTLAVPPAAATGAITLIAPASTETDTIVARLTSDVDLVSVNHDDFTLISSDTGNVISADVTIQKQGDYFWDITVQQADDYGGYAYLQIRAEGFLTLQTIQRVPSSTLFSNEFEFIIPPSAAPTGVRASNGIYGTVLRWDVISEFTYEYRIQGGAWLDAVSPQRVTGLTPDTDYNIDLRVKADGVAPAGLITTIYLRTLSFPIESIDEQFILIGTENYELIIGLLGQNLDARVDGLQEGFYQTFETLDDGNSQIKIKADLVKRLLEKAVWRVNYHDLDNDVRADSEIIYNVVAVAPIFVDPGEQQIYKGVPFEFLVEVLNNPAVQRGECELVGLTIESTTIDDRTYLKSAGILPADTNLTFDSFDADYYIENPGGFDNLQVPFTIRDDAVTPVISRLTGGTWTGEVSQRFQVTGVPDPVVRLSADSPDWLMVARVGETTTYEITGTAPAEGTYMATVLATGFGTVQQQITITIERYVPPVQPIQPPVAVTSPVIRSIANVSRTLGYSAFTIQASLSQGSGVSWGISGIPGANISSTGLITIPAGLSQNVYTGTVTASNSGGSDTETFSLSVQSSVVSPSGTITLQTVAGNGRVDLSWNHPTQRGVPYTGYDVFRSTRSDMVGATTIADDLLALNYSDTNVSNGTTYYYRVRLDSYTSHQSSIVSATPAAAPQVVAPVIAGIANVSRTSGYSQFTIQASLSSGSTPTWSISGIAGATISESGLITIPAGLSVASHTATVTARNSAGPDTETFNVVVSAGVPAKPTNVTFVRWESSTFQGTTTYQPVIRFDEPVDNGSAVTGIYEEFVNGVGGTNSFNPADHTERRMRLVFSAGGTREVRIAFVNANGRGPFSDALSLTAPNP